MVHNILKLKLISAWESNRILIVEKDRGLAQYKVSRYKKLAVVTLSNIDRYYSESSQNDDIYL